MEKKQQVNTKSQINNARKGFLPYNLIENYTHEEFLSKIKEQNKPDIKWVATEKGIFLFSHKIK